MIINILIIIIYDKHSLFLTLVSTRIPHLKVIRLGFNFKDRINYFKIALAISTRNSAGTVSWQILFPRALRNPVRENHRAKNEHSKVYGLSGSSQNARRFSRSAGIVSGHSIRARVIIVVIRRTGPRNDLRFLPFVSESRVMDLGWLPFSARFPLRPLSAIEEPTEIRCNKSPVDFDSALPG